MHNFAKLASIYVMAHGEAGGWRGAGEVTVTPVKSARAARAVEALMARHAELREVLDHWAGALASAADSGSTAWPVRNLLHAFLADEVLPHARAQERTLYRAARLLARRAPDRRRLAAWDAEWSRTVPPRTGRLCGTGAAGAVALADHGPALLADQACSAGWVPAVYGLAGSGRLGCRPQGISGGLVPLP
jgi:hypothetical protein